MWRNLCGAEYLMGYQFEVAITHETELFVTDIPKYVYMYDPKISVHLRAGLHGGWYTISENTGLESRIGHMFTLRRFMRDMGFDVSSLWNY